MLCSVRSCYSIDALVRFSSFYFINITVRLFYSSLLCLLIFKGNFSDPARFRCLGCNDGYFTQYLVRSRGWTYARLPVEGLRSLMFHGPSPTHCIAAGNVWFDHPQVNKVGCLSHETVHKMLRRDAKREKHHMFDVQHFTKSDRICLRLTATGHSVQSKTCFES